MPEMGKDAGKAQPVRAVPSISQLEADVAYFEARLSLLGRPDNPYQAAQLKAYRLIEGQLIEKLVYLREHLQHRGCSVDGDAV